MPRTKGDRSGKGRYFKAPALKRLCPVEAYQQWISTAQIAQGPAFRAINRWGQLAENALHPNSIIGIVRSCCQNAGIENSNAFSSHSLRRGFANWANDQRWDTKSLMEYVGWRDVQSAMRYIDAPDPFARLRIDHRLDEAGASANRLNPSETE